MTKIAFVTGATGLLGHNLVRLLVDTQWQVKALVRSRSKAERLLGDLAGVELVVGDLLDVHQFAPALAGVTVLFNTAAYFRETFARLGDHWPMLERVNVHNTLRLFELAEHHQVAKIVHTSSTAAIRKRADGSPSDERDLADAHEAREPFARSKIVGDHAIAAFAATHHTPIISVYPGWMFDPFDSAPTGGGKLVLDFLARRLPGVVDAHLDVVDVRDVAQGMLHAAERQWQGASTRYVLGGQYASLAEVYRMLAAVSGVPAPRWRLPNALALGAAWGAERAAAFTSTAPTLTVNAVRNLTHNKRTDSSKAQREIGVTFRPLDETFNDAVQWFRAHGYTARIAHGTVSHARQRG